MAEINPPLYLDQDDAYGASELGLPYRDIMGEGIVGAADMVVTAGTGLKSSVDAGAAWVKGDDNADTQPTYRVRNDAPVLLQHDAADATNPRIDLVIAQVKDATFSGVSKLWQLAIVKGTPAVSPAAPALPTDAIALAEVTIPAGSGTLGTITDRRTRALVGGGAALGGPRYLGEVVIAADGLNISSGELPGSPDLSTYKKIKVEIVGVSASNTATDQVSMEFNGDSAAHYLWERLDGNGASAGSTGSLAMTFAEAGWAPGVVTGSPVVLTIDIWNDGVHAPTWKSTWFFANNNSAISNMFVGQNGGWYEVGGVVSSIVLGCAGGAWRAGARARFWGEV